MTDDTKNNRVGPLNATKDEAEYLWEMIKDEIGDEDVWESGEIDTVRSLHTKIRKIAVGDDQ